MALQLGRLLSLLSLSLVIGVLLTSSPATALSDEQVNAWLKRKDSSLKPLTITRRDAAGAKTKHLRPVTTDEAPSKVKRDITPPDIGQVAEFSGDPQPQRNGAGGLFSGDDTNHAIDAQNPDNVAGPTTDAGVVPNLKWSFSSSHTRLLKGGWVREQVITDLPPSKDVAGAELRLAPFAYRELHWHRVAEWGYILNGTGRISAIDEQGRSFISDVVGPSAKGDPDIYYFPPGVPHSIQALSDGLEILLIFTDGNFDSLGTTFMLSDWLAHTPLSVVAQNFGLNVSELANIPQRDPYIIPLPSGSPQPPPAGHANEGAPTSPDGTVPNPFVFSLSKQPKTVAKGGGGWIKIQDSATNFPVSKDIASALVFVEPNGLRELHWHAKDEWLYVIHGRGRATAFAGSSTARTFDFQAGDTGVFPNSYGTYLKNLSPTEPLIFLEIFKADRFVDFSATQWLALTPPQVVADLLNISVATVERFKKEKQFIVS